MWNMLPWKICHFQAIPTLANDLISSNFNFLIYKMVITMPSLIASLDNYENKMR